MNSTTLYPTTNTLQIPAPIIYAHQLDHYFGQGQLRKQVLFGINLEINAGEIVLMTGPSGSGKTTLLTLIGGLRSGQSGSLKILGQEMCKASAEIGKGAAQNRLYFSGAQFTPQFDGAAKRADGFGSSREFVAFPNARSLCKNARVSRTGTAD